MTPFGAGSDQAQFDRFAAQQGFQAIFNESYTEAYRAFAAKLACAAAASDERILAVDTGCGDGWTAEMLSSLRSGRYIGIDPSGVSLEKLSSRMAKHPNLVCTGFQKSGEWLMTADARREISAILGQEPNLLICNATFHQLQKVFPGIREVLIAGIGLMRRGADVVVGDYYYPDSLARREVEAVRDWIRSQGQNPTPRAGFFKPESIRSFLETAGVKITACDDVQANPDFPLRYYVYRGRVGKPRSAS